MSTKYEMPVRQNGDGPVAVNRPSPGRIGVSVATGAQIQEIVMSEYNAWRIFGLLSVMLGLPLSKAVSKAIKLEGPPGGQGLEMKFTRDVPEDAPLGMKVAAKLADREMAKRMREQGLDVEETATGLTVSPNMSDTKGGGT